jgi:NADH-quinone oxidoreductase subunit L
MPLVALAICSVFAGYLGLPQSLGGTNRFEKFLSPVFASEAQTIKAETAAVGKSEEHTPSAEYALMLLSVGAAIGGWFMASRAYGKAAKGYKEPIQVAAPPVYSTLLNKYYVDEAYDYAFTGRRKLGPVRLGVIGLGEASWKFDAKVIDGSVNGAGWITRFSAALSNWWDKWIIDGVLVNGPAILARLLSYPTRLFEWGLVQWYALVMVVGLVGFVWYYAIR